MTHQGNLEIGLH